MSQLVRIPDGMRYMDMLEERISALERQVARAVGTYSVTAGYTADRAFDPQITSINEVAAVLGTLIDDLRAAGVLQ